MKLVVTDGTTLSGGGVSLERFSRYAQVTVYDLTPPEQLAERALRATTTSTLPQRRRTA